MCISLKQLHYTYTSPISRNIPRILEKLTFTGIHQSSITLPQDHFNDVIAQWEVNRNIFMVHLRRRILNLPVSLSVARHKNRHKKKTSNAKGTPRSHGAEGRRRGVHLHWKGSWYAQGGVFIKSPVKRNGINCEKYFCIIRDISTRTCICIMRRIIRLTSIYSK